MVKIVAPHLGDPDVHDPVNVALFLSIVVVYLLASVAGAASVSAAVGRSEVGARIYRFALYPAVLAVLAWSSFLSPPPSGVSRCGRGPQPSSPAKRASWPPPPS